MKAVNPEDFLLQTSGNNNNAGDRFSSPNKVQQPSSSEFTIPYSNYIKNLIEKSGKPILEPVSNQGQGAVPSGQQGNFNRPVSRPRPEIVTIGDNTVYDYSSKRYQQQDTGGYTGDSLDYDYSGQGGQQKQQQNTFNKVSIPSPGPGNTPAYDYSPQRQQQQQQAPQPPGSSSTSSSHSPAGVSSSAAAASGTGATTSTSTRSGVPEPVAATPDNNEYYPCLDNSCEPESSVDVFYEDYQDENEDLLQQVFGPASNTLGSAVEPLEPNDAVVIDTGNRRPTGNNPTGNNPTGNSPTGSNPPVFKDCTTLEECLGSGNTQTLSESDEISWLTPLDYDYDYDSIDAIQPIRPPQEANFAASNVNKYLDEALRPQDSIVTRPVFTPDGTLLFEAEKSGSEEKLDRLINSLGSLISLLNATKEQGIVRAPL